MKNAEVILTPLAAPSFLLDDKLKAVMVNPASHHILQLSLGQLKGKCRPMATGNNCAGEFIPP